ncbi:hypothetical protein FVE85_3990 [Porphyridium purpureum]|uniref:B box-type domain-containing protein n=1 Tax=Porphyridium purpureum TaxID=35688 RepID=A0A5J4YRV3_PORPP|nr:hypothetical protein FVE85_3990 [Porphyridium purpureum]|eukprot:POR4830..scf229_5
MMRNSTNIVQFRVVCCECGAAEARRWCVQEMAPLCERCDVARHKGAADGASGLRSQRQPHERVAIAHDSAMAVRCERCLEMPCSFYSRSQHACWCETCAAEMLQQQQQQQQQHLAEDAAVKFPHNPLQEQDAQHESGGTTSKDTINPVATVKKDLLAPKAHVQLAVFGQHTTENVVFEKMDFSAGLTGNKGTAPDPWMIAKDHRRRKAATPSARVLSSLGLPEPVHVKVARWLDSEQNLTNVAVKDTGGEQGSDSRADLGGNTPENIQEHRTGDQRKPQKPSQLEESAPASMSTDSTPLELNTRPVLSSHERSSHIDLTYFSQRVPQFVVQDTGNHFYQAQDET